MQLLLCLWQSHNSQKNYQCAAKTFVNYHQLTVASKICIRFTITENFGGFNL